MPCDVQDASPAASLSTLSRRWLVSRSYNSQKPRASESKRRPPPACQG